MTGNTPATLPLPFPWRQGGFLAAAYPGGKRKGSHVPHAGNQDAVTHIQMTMPMKIGRLERGASDFLCRKVGNPERLVDACAFKPDEPVTCPRCLAMAARLTKAETWPCVCCWQVFATESGYKKHVCTNGARAPRECMTCELLFSPGGRELRCASCRPVALRQSRREARAAWRKRNPEADKALRRARQKRRYQREREEDARLLTAVRAGSDLASGGSNLKDG